MENSDFSATDVYRESDRENKFDWQRGASVIGIALFYISLPWLKEISFKHCGKKLNVSCC